MRVIFCDTQNNQGRGGLITLYQNLDYREYSGASPLGHLYSRDTFIQGHKIWSWNNAHIIFVSITSVEGTPLFRGKGHIVWVPKPRFILHSGDMTDYKKG